MIRAGADSAKPLRLRRPKISEAAVLSAVLIRLQYDRRVAWVARMNSGAHAVGEGKARRFIRYGFQGCSDIIGQLVDGRFLAVEVKRPTGRATDAQALFLAEVDRHGGVSGIVRSVSDVDALLSGIPHEEIQRAPRILSSAPGIRSHPPF